METTLDLPMGWGIMEEAPGAQQIWADFTRRQGSINGVPPKRWGGDFMENPIIKVDDHWLSTPMIQETLMSSELLSFAKSWDLKIEKVDFKIQNAVRFEQMDSLNILENHSNSGFY